MEPTRVAPVVSIVVPTYNERQNLPRLVEAVRKHVRVPYEIVIVDDASPDGTADLARDLAREHPIRLVSRPGKAGLGSAYRDGFSAARGRFVFEMDADLSHDPRFIPVLLEAVERQGADIAIGSRYVPGGRVVGWTRYRRLVSGVGNGLARIFLRARDLRDLTSGYRCYARGPASDLVQAARSDGYAFQVEVLHLARQRGLRVVEVPITFENRTVGKSKLGVREFGRFVRTLARLRVSARAPPAPGRVAKPRPVPRR
jgi:dolichol-phosphate mannosyltransferase